MLRIEVHDLHSWKSLFRTTRGSVSVLFVAAMSLVLPAQTGDELVALEQIKVGAVPGLFILQFALGFLAVSAWYWSRAALAARFGVDDALESRRGIKRCSRTAFDAIPRISFGCGVVLSLALVWRSPSWLHAGSVAAWSIPAFLLIRVRLAIASPRRRSEFVNLAVLRSRRHMRPWLRVIFPRLRALLMLAPFGPWVSTPLLGLGVIGFGWGAAEGFVSWGGNYPGLPALAARLFPGPSVALVCFALMMGPLTALVFVMDGLRMEGNLFGRRTGLSRPPVILGLLGWSLLAPVVFNLHSIRVLPPARRVVAVDQRVALESFFLTWAKACAPDATQPARPIIVAISGGAARAGIWGAQVLAAVDAATGQGDASVFAVSSVSGGSLGAAAYMAMMKATNAQCRQPEGTPSRVRELLDKVNNEDLGGDALGPLLAGALLSDAPRALFSPAAALVRLVANIQPHGGDRAEALERAFEASWSNDLRRAKLATIGVPLFSAAYLSLVYKQGLPQPGMPVWIVNGTDLTTGERMLTVPFGSMRTMQWPFRAAGDVLGLLGADVPISTAINNGARFPYLEPSGELMSVKDKPKQFRDASPELLDGGYFDNEGLLTALELADWLKAQMWNGRPVEPIIVQATANADIDAEVRASVVRCPDSPIDQPTVRAPAGRTLEMLVPVIGLYNVREAHAAVLLREVRDQYCGSNGRRSFFHFYLFNSPDHDIPLNWLLSPAIVQTIRRQLTAGGVAANTMYSANDAEYRNLLDATHPAASAHAPVADRAGTD